MENTNTNPTTDLQYTTKEMANDIRNAINRYGLLPKTISLPHGYYHFWYANNRGKKYNTTIIRSSSYHRANRSAAQTDVLGIVNCNFWHGKPFISYANAKKLIG